MDSENKKMSSRFDCLVDDNNTVNTKKNEKTKKNIFNQETNIFKREETNNRFKSDDFKSNSFRTENRFKSTRNTYDKGYNRFKKQRRFTDNRSEELKKEMEKSKTDKKETFVFNNDEFPSL